MPEINQFKVWIKHEMEKRINDFPDLGYDDGHEIGKRKEIAVVSFAYRNA